VKSQQKKTRRTLFRAQTSAKTAHP